MKFFYTYELKQLTSGWQRYCVEAETVEDAKKIIIGKITELLKVVEAIDGSWPNLPYWSVE